MSSSTFVLEFGGGRFARGGVLRHPGGRARDAVVLPIGQGETPAQLAALRGLFSEIGYADALLVHQFNAETFEVPFLVQTELVSRFGCSRTRGYRRLHVASIAIAHLIGKIFCQLAFRDVRRLLALVLGKFS
jgi:hypothetical protein